MLRTARMQYEGYRAAAEVLGKILARPPLLDVWEKSCPGLLRAKTRELALQTEGTASYDGAFVEKLRIEQIYSAVVDLKSLETERPIREGDIRARFDAVSRLAAVEQAKVMAQEKLLAEELAAIGDGSETVAEYAGKLAESLSTSQLRLSDCKLLQLPPLVCSFIHIEVLDLSANALEALPPEICQLTALKKLYAVDNKSQGPRCKMGMRNRYLLAPNHIATECGVVPRLRCGAVLTPASPCRLATVPDELWKLHRTLMYLALGGNPLVAEVRQLYLEGLPVLLAHLKLRHRRRRREATSEQGFFPRLASHHGAEAIRATRSASEPNKGVLPFTSYPPTPLPAKRGVFTRGVTLDDTDLPDYRPPRDRAPAPGVAPVLQTGCGTAAEMDAEAEAEAEAAQRRLEEGLRTRSWSYGLAGLLETYGSTRSRGISGP